MSFRWIIRVKLLFILVAGVVLSGCGVVAAPLSPAPAATATTCSCTELTGKVTYSYQKVAEFSPPGLIEPVGLAFHPGRESLFIATRPGLVLEIDLNDGQVIQQKQITRNLELAGITYHSGRDLLYLVVADGFSLLEVSLVELLLLREINLIKAWPAEIDRPRPEGLAFVPTAGRPEEGSFYLSAPSGPAKALVLVVTAEGQPVTFFTLTVRDLASLAYDPVTKELLASSASSSLLFRFNLTGQGRTVFALPGQNPAAIALDETGQRLYAGEATGRVVTYRVVAP